MSYPHIKAKIICDSVNNNTGDRLTTFELTYPRYIHCFDKETEVLCYDMVDDAAKFVPFPKAVKSPNRYKPAQVHKDTHVIEYVNPEAWIARKHKGYVICSTTEKVNFCVTPEHRMYVGHRLSKSTSNEIVLASKLAEDHPQYRLYTNGNIVHTADISPEAAALCIWIAADGSIDKGKKKYLTFHFKKERKIKEVKKLLKANQVPFTACMCADGATLLNAKISDFVIPGLYRTLRYQDFYTRTGSKKLPNFMASIDARAFKAAFKAMLLSDGNVDNQDYNSSSEQLIDDLQVLCHTHGKSFNKNKYANGMYKVTFMKEDSPIIRRDKKPCYAEKYSGMVYCCTVPTGLLMVRRCGQVHISGNCELMTHRVFSRNAQSSRAIPTAKRISAVRTNPVRPILWNQNQKGMQAKDTQVESVGRCQTLWDGAASYAAEAASFLNEQGLHKQWVNRLLEPFDTITVIVSATEYTNFFGLRCAPDAQPEIQCLAWRMAELYFEKSDPVRCYPEQLLSKTHPDLMGYTSAHLPYIDAVTVSEVEDFVDRIDNRGDMQLFDIPHIRVSSREGLILQILVCISVGRCARVSYLSHEGTKKTIEEEVLFHNGLRDSFHMSPFEHAAYPLDNADQSSGGNFNGWVQYRATMPFDTKSFVYNPSNRPAWTR